MTNEMNSVERLHIRTFIGPTYLEFKVREKIWWYVGSPNLETEPSRKVVSLMV